MNWITKNIANFMTDVITGILTLFGDVIDTIFDVMVVLNKTSIISTALTFTTVFGASLLVIMALKQGLDTYVLRTEGDSGEDPIDLLARCSKAVAIMLCNPFIFDELFNFSRAFNNDLVGEVNSSGIIVHAQDLITTIIIDLSSVGLIWLILLLVLAIGLICFCIMAAIRGGELMLFKILFPIFAVDMIAPGKERWNQFITAYAVSFFGYTIQRLSFQVFVYLFIRVAVGQLPYMIACIGWGVIMIRAPKWLEKFAYSSGLSSALKGGARTGVMMLPYVFK